MNEHENDVLDRLEKIISLAKELHGFDETLGSMMLSNIKFSMDLYEAIAKDEFYNISELVLFYARMQNITTNDLLSRSYPRENITPTPTADDDLTKFIMNADASFEPDTDAYEQKVRDLIADFKSAASHIR